MTSRRQRDCEFGADRIASPCYFSCGGDARLLARHLSEQYLTSAQFFAHDLRHVISKPHTAQALEGSKALFPLKLINNYA